MDNILNKILTFDNNRVDPTIISTPQIEKLVEKLIETIDNNIEGDIVEFGCYVGESSKYLTKTLIETNSNKKLFVYDSFEGLPELSNWEKDTGWTPGTLNTTEDILISNFKRNNLPIPYIHKDWFINIPEYKIPEKISFAFLDGDFYNSIYDSLTKIYDKVSDGGYILFHDYKRNDLPGVEAAIRDFFRERNINYDVQEITEQLGFFIKTNTHEYIESKEKNITNLETINNGVTLVTGLWDLGRSNLTDGWSRSFDHYIEKFRQLLKVDSNMIIFGDENLKKIVFENRTEHNTLFVHRSLDWFKQNEYFDLIQQIRTNPNWYNKVGWLTESTQAKLEMYNPLVMSKMFLLHDAKILDKFNSEHMFWIDAGLTNTVHYGYFTHDKVINKLPNYFNKFSFICFPYEANTEIHGFDYKEMNNIVNGKINKVARAGFFGGPKESIPDVNTIYYGILLSTLKSGFMGTEESIFTLMCYKHPELINYFEIESNGLLGTFFENLKNDSLEVKNERELSHSNILNTNKVALYVITFNSPNQFEVLIQSMLDYDRDFIDKPKKFLLDNSTDLSTTTKYKELCELYGFEHIKKDNLGIVGGRIFVADHFEETGLDFYYWFEDDMAFYPKKGEVCRNGFNRYVSNLYEKTLEIITKENFDFLKLNFSEFFGDNSTQWSWYNVPQEFRKTNWPEKPNLPVHGLDPDAPKTLFKNIKTHKELPYASGEIYICNWPILLTKEGNYKCYLETKWAHPFEQTLMSHCFQETIKGKINPGILLLTPTEHNRFEHYDGRLRKES